MASTSSARGKRRSIGVLGVILVVSACGSGASAQDADRLLRRTSAPGVAFQVSMCLDEETKQLIFDKLRQGFRTPATPRPDVRTTCSGGRQNFGVWLEPVAGSAYPLANSGGRAIGDAARDRGLDAVDIIAADEMFAWSASREFMEAAREKVWASIERRYGTDGVPDPHGPIHLRSLALDLQPPSKLRLVLRGSYDSGVGALDFHARLTDALALQDGWVTSTPATSLSLDDKAAAIALGIVAEVLFPPAAILVMDAYDRSGSKSLDSFSNKRLGTMLVSAAPTESMDSGGTKKVFRHTRLEVTEGGVVAGGTVAFDQPREPAVTILGPDTVEMANADRAAAQFQARTYDLRATRESPLNVRWSSDGAIARQGALTTSIAFTPRGRRGNGRAGQLRTEVVTLTVTDADGLTATARKVVTLRDLRGDLPAICVQRPHLPQCGPTQRRPRP